MGIPTEFQRILQLGNRNLLLFGVFIAIAFGVRLPLSQEVLTSYPLTTPLVALIFIAQGLNMNFGQAGQLRKYLKIILAGTIIAVIAYPAMASAFTKLFALTDDFALGFILICCFPNSLEAAMAMTMSADGDRITAVVLLIGLSLVGIVSIPLNIFIWIGGAQGVSATMILAKIFGYVFLPIFVGQILRRTFPTLPDKTKELSHYVPILCLTVLVYISCSREADLFHQLQLGDIVHTFFPSATLHIVMLILALFTGKFLLKLNRKDNRSFIFITSEKPMSLSVALWSVTYASSHPTSIFPILVFYIGQMIIDSFIISRLKLQDCLNNEKSAA